MNNSNAEIKKLSEDVNQVRRERVIYDNVFKKLELDLKQKEEKLKKLINENLSIELNREDMIDSLKKEIE